MYLAIDGVAVLVAIVVQQGILHPIAAQAVHRETGVSPHQFLGEEAGHVAVAYDDVAIKDVAVIADVQHLAGVAVVFKHAHAVDVHQDALRPHLDFPFVASFGIVVIKRRELLQVLVPPLHYIAFIKDIFMSYLGKFVAVILRVAAHDDFWAFLVDSGVSSVFKMLVSDVSVVPFKRVVPF